MNNKEDVRLINIRTFKGKLQDFESFIADKIKETMHDKNKKK